MFFKIWLFIQTYNVYTKRKNHKSFIFIRYSLKWYACPLQNFVISSCPFQFHFFPYKRTSLNKSCFFLINAVMHALVHYVFYHLLILSPPVCCTGMTSLFGTCRPSICLHAVCSLRMTWGTRRLYLCYMSHFRVCWLSLQSWRWKGPRAAQLELYNKETQVCVTWLGYNPDLSSIIIFFPIFLCLF